MQRMRSCGVQGWATALLVLLGCAAVAAAQARDQERVEYWQKEHGVLSAAEDARVAKAHDIFSA